MNLNTPKLEPVKTSEKPKTEKAGKDEIASKPDDTPKTNKTDYKDKKIEGSSQKPKDKPKNKIEPRKIDIQKEPKHKIQHQKSNHLTPPRNKIERQRIDIQKDPRHKIQHQKSNHLTPPRNKIERPTLDLTREPKNKITSPKLESKDMQNFDTDIDTDNIPSIQNIKILKLEKIKEEIKNLDWKSISDNWSITTHPNQYAKSLDPTKIPSLENPLYRNKEWLNKVYHNKNWNLSDKKIANLCGVSQSTITQWRKRHQIPRKEGNWVNISNGNAQGKWLNVKTGRVWVAMPEEYTHPELKPLQGGGFIRPEHTFEMEKYLVNNPQLELSKKYLIQGKYLKKGIEIHHINQIKQDNRIKNLWIYENKKEHARGELTLYDTLKTLIRTKQILFKDGKYAMNQDFKSIKSHQQQIEKPINYKDINLVKEEIKKIDWNSISNNWSVHVKKNQFVQKMVRVDPMRDCSENNPLHHHRDWVKRIVNDKCFNLTDSRLAELCGIKRDTARYWRERVHGIKGKTEWGFERRIDDKDGRIWVRVPKDYKNPVVQKEDHHRRIMLEHRYVIEQHLAKHPELEISKVSLIDGKYLKTEAHVHHINLNYQDNRKENLWVFENVKKHNVASKSLYGLVESLLTKESIGFKNGEYYIN